MIVSDTYEIIKYIKNNKEKVLNDLDLILHLIDLKKLLEELL